MLPQVPVSHHLSFFFSVLLVRKKNVGDAGDNLPAFFIFPKISRCSLHFPNWVCLSLFLCVSSISGFACQETSKDTFFPDHVEATGSLLTRDHSFARNVQSGRFVPPRPRAPSSLPEEPQREGKIRASTPGTRISPMEKLCYLPAEIYKVVIAHHRPVPSSTIKGCRCKDMIPAISSCWCPAELCCYKITSLKGTVHPKMFQTCLTFSLLWSTKYILKNILTVCPYNTTSFCTLWHLQCILFV